ncbi:ROK family protein [Metabacillus sp. GX 13764]|uniref:ROK family protein n=1 Tax=Metabacillus kandeliae TaxID=2900151 RepID=UPI001E3DE10A|nr:ROK family protein [Metabacillus kandeliae]MCD7035599.1 ROK family protein [Metabacillus kandeliae]
MKLGGIEAGGTKFICAAGDEKGNIVEQIQIPTLSPEETMPAVYDFFSRHQLDAIGIGSFGPIDVDTGSPSYGSVTSTPKIPWRNFQLAGALKEKFDVPVGFTTDVNAAALGEAVYGAAKGLDSCLYLTVGTGIGGGAIVKGEVLQGLSHPEMGHILVRKHPEDTYRGKCPYHGDCLEGLAAGPAIEERWGKKGIELADRPEVWEMEGFYLAQALMQYALILSPKKIILGGGVMKQTHLFPIIHKHFKALMKEYVVLPEYLDSINEYIVPPGLGDKAGIIGSLLLAEKALNEGEN